MRPIPGSMPISAATPPAIFRTAPARPTNGDFHPGPTCRGRQASFLASENDYQFVRALQLHDAIVPVVGNLAGPSALAAVGRAIRQRGETLSVFYVSNVELYLFQNGVFTRYADTLSGLPHNSRSVLIRSIFSDPGVWPLPDTAPGYASASVMQRIDEFIANYHARKYLTYEGLISEHR